MDRCPPPVLHLQSFELLRVSSVAAPLQLFLLRVAAVLFVAAPSLLGLPVVHTHRKAALAEELQQQPAIRLSESFSSLG